MLEALAVGRSVVSTAVSGSEVVAAAGAGAVVPIEDPAALATALVTRLRDRTATDDEGRRGADHIARHHRLEDVVTDVSAVIARAYAYGRPALTSSSGAARRTRPAVAVPSPR
jgi:glycosyltransferase involved in cell wall biosynthesis